MQSSLIRQLFSGALLALLVAALAVPQAFAGPRGPRGEDEPRDPREADRLTIASKLEKVAKTHGRSAHAYEILRVLYRYGTQRYSGDFTLGDRAVALAMRRADQSPRRVMRMFRSQILPIEDSIRNVMHPALAELSFDAEAREIKRAVQVWQKKQAEGECQEPANPMTPFGLGVCETAGEFHNPKLGPLLPTLHSAYESERPRPAALPGLPGPVRCVSDRDCRDHNDFAHAHCGQGLTAADYTDEPEVIGSRQDTCAYGAQWPSDSRIIVQGRGFFDVDAFALLVHLEDESGRPVVNNVRQGSDGHVYLDLPDGDVESAFESAHARLISAVHVSGGAAPGYLEATLQTETYHRPNDYHGWSDLLSFQLPPNLLPGKYALRALSNAEVVLDVTRGTIWAAEPQQVIGEMDLHMSNAIDIRIMGDRMGPESVRYSIPRGQVSDTQETYDDISVGALIYKFTPPEITPGATPEDAQRELERMVATLEAGELPPNIEEVFNGTSGEIEGIPDDSEFNIGRIVATTTINPDQALLAFTEIWEIDSGDAPEEFTSAVAGLTAVLIEVATLAIAEYGITAVAEGCVEAYSCIIAVAVVVALIIIEWLWNMLGEAEFLGLSTTLYPYDVVRMLTRAQENGITVPQVRARHDNGTFVIPSLIRTTGSFDYGPDASNDGPVNYNVESVMDGEPSSLVINGGFSPRRYDEVRKIRSVNTEAWPDDTATYRLNVRIESITP